MGRHSGNRVIYLAYKESATKQQRCLGMGIRTRHGVNKLSVSSGWARAILAHACGHQRGKLYKPACSCQIWRLAFWPVMPRRPTNRAPTGELRSIGKVDPRLKALAPRPSLNQYLRLNCLRIVRPGGDGPASPQVLQPALHFGKPLRSTRKGFCQAPIGYLATRLCCLADVLPPSTANRPSDETGDTLLRYGRHSYPARSVWLRPPGCRPRQDRPEDKTDGVRKLVPPYLTG